MQHHETALILDFGSQYTQLIARRVRELNIYCEIVPFRTPLEEIRSKQPNAIILSGGPSSVYADDAPHCDRGILDLGIPVLGICYGMQMLAYFLGGKVESSDRREFGAASVTVSAADSRLFTGLPAEIDVWMSHGDHVTQAPEGFVVTATTKNALGSMENPARGLFALQFHPEVVHTPLGKDILRNFLVGVAGMKADWTMRGFIESSVATIREQVGDAHVVCGLSGGVDSTVAAALVSKAVGDRLICLFVDNGVLRKNEFQEVLEMFRDMHLNVKGIAAGERFLSELAGVTDPEKKRKTIGRVFIEVFQEEAEKLGDIKFLVQGTLYPDVIESVSVKGPSAVIKSHHNVGGLPDILHLELVEPLRELFKDEVRAVGRELGLPEEIVGRQPFPGPGLAVRILGEVTADRVALLQKADAIVQEEIRAAGLYDAIWQAFAVLLPVQSVGVMGDERTYENTCAIRAVESQDGMTADWVRLPYEVLHRISSRVISEVRGINRVVYDISSKPPATIEWE